LAPPPLIAPEAQGGIKLRHKNNQRFGSRVAAHKLLFTYLFYYESSFSLFFLFTPTRVRNISTPLSQKFSFFLFFTPRRCCAAKSPGIREEVTFF